MESQIKLDQDIPIDSYFFVTVRDNGEDILLEAVPYENRQDKMLNSKIQELNDGFRRSQGRRKLIRQLARKEQIYQIMKEIYTQISAQQGEVQVIQTNQDEFNKENMPSTATQAVQQIKENFRVYLKIKFNIKMHFHMNQYQQGVETDLKDAYLKGDTQVVKNYLRAAKASLRKIVITNVSADISSVCMKLYHIKKAKGPKMLEDQVKFDKLKVILSHLQEIQTYLIE